MYDRIPVSVLNPQVLRLRRSGSRLIDVLRSLEKYRYPESKKKFLLLYTLILGIGLSHPKFDHTYEVETFPTL